MPDLANEDLLLFKQDNNFKFYRVTPFSEGSRLAFNSGQIPKIAKFQKFFFNPDTGEYFKTTDLAINKNSRKKVFQKFYNTYFPFYNRKVVSILTGVVSLNDYPKIGNFISDFKKKLKRKKIEIYGYIWCRDFEEEQFREHVHIYFATSRITPEMMKELFFKKKHTLYNFTFPTKSFNAAIIYLIKKELFGASKMRTYSKSRKFIVPEIHTIKT